MRSDILEQAKRREAAVQVAVHYLPDDVAVRQPKSLYIPWDSAGIAYETDDLRLYEGTLYRCRGAHVSDTEHDPVKAPSLWRQLPWAETE